MKRNEIVTKVGQQFLTSNVENDEFDYPKAFKELGIDFDAIVSDDGNRTFKDVDIRFVKDGVSILVETKRDFSKVFENAKKQLGAYVEYEKKLTANKVIAILADTDDNQIKVWRNTVSGDSALENEHLIKSIQEYCDMFAAKSNNKEEVMRNTYALNELLHENGIGEKLRSQFVGTCLLALKNHLNYSSATMTSPQIIAGIKEVLSNLLGNDINRAEKLALLSKNVLDSQDVRDLKVENFRKILKFVDEKILPFINDKSTAGQDLLNLFFVQFNKYVGKADKNQAFTPDHITDFMAKIVGVNRNSRVLDPCCGSGSFLVRAMTQAMDDCATEDELKEVKKHHIFGIEYDENIYGLATTNMLIHSDGNSNIRQASCFDLSKEIKSWNINTVLMNPPYNATKKQMPKDYIDTWGDSKEDPSKGLYFVKYIASLVHSGMMAVLLPMACAIGSSKKIAKIKESILTENTLDAVFSLPAEIFYPGASVTACCMVFKLGVRNNAPGNPPTFFGYFRDDGFIKKKNLGRVEKVDPVTGKGYWSDIEKKWMQLYKDRKPVDGLCAVKKVTGKDEWLAEAYMETDYSTLQEDDFEKTVRDYYSYLVKTGD
jgi:type I restriction enzyme M protein